MSYGLPFSGKIYGCDGKNTPLYLPFPNPQLNSNEIYSKIPINYHKFGSNMYSSWTPYKNIDKCINLSSGGNGFPMGPYYQIGIGNMPNSMYELLNFGKKRRKSPRRKSPKRKSPKRKKRKSPKRSKFCLPKEKKFPVNTRKRCSAALSYARYAKDPCKIARCVKKNCSKYPNVGKYSTLMKKCNLI